MPTVTIHKGPTIRLTQKNRPFYYVPIPSKRAAEMLGFQALEWDEQTSAFAGFNRDLDEQHVLDILHGLEAANALIPNPIIAYLLTNSTKFVPQHASSPPIEFGSIEITASPQDQANKIGFVIDGQHRLEALRRRDLESGEDDLAI